MLLELYTRKKPDGSWSKLQSSNYDNINTGDLAADQINKRVEVFKQYAKDMDCDIEVSWYFATTCKDMTFYKNINIKAPEKKPMRIINKDVNKNDIDYTTF